VKRVFFSTGITFRFRSRLAFFSRVVIFSLHIVWFHPTDLSTMFPINEHLWLHSRILPYCRSNAVSDGILICNIDGLGYNLKWMIKVSSIAHDFERGMKLQLLISSDSLQDVRQNFDTPHLSFVNVCGFEWCGRA
jgi:hypothetical protein